MGKDTDYTDTALDMEKLSETKPSDVVIKPWGNFVRLAAGEGYQVKRLVVRPGQMLSLQRHMHRDEVWVVVCGTAEVTTEIGGVVQDEFLCSEGDYVEIPKVTRHRLANPGKIDLVIIEIQTGAYLGEDDIERFDDVYDRICLNTTKDITIPMES